MITLEALAAARFLTELGTGSTKPCVFSCVDIDGESAGEYVVKFRSTVRGGGNGLCFEFLAAQLAALLGIASPKPALIDLDRDLFESTEELAVRERIGNSLGVNFGTEYRTPGYTTWPIRDTIPPHLRQVAAEIVAFDVLIDNADRRQEKPNILYKGDEILVIDHEMAFACTRLIGQASGGWSAGRVQFIYNHPFYSGLRRQPLDLDRFIASVGKITDDEIRAICAAVPADFGTEYLERISQHLAETRDRVGPMIDSIRRVMQ